ncbi:MAG: hypothetical protein ABI605_10980 [Rhizobacter sp.]
MERKTLPVHTVTGLTNAHLAEQIDLIKLDLTGVNGPECEVFITAADLQQLVKGLEQVLSRWAARGSPGQAH